MTLRTPQQNQRLHTLLADAGLTGDKEALAQQFSQGRTGRTSLLTVAECAALIQALEVGLGLSVAHTPAQQHEMEKMRRKLLSLAHELRWELPDGRVDMARLNGWCQQYSGRKKVLNHFGHAELVKLVSQLKIVHAKYLKELEK